MQPDQHDKDLVDAHRRRSPPSFFWVLVAVLLFVIGAFILLAGLAHAQSVLDAYPDDGYFVMAWPIDAEGKHARTVPLVYMPFFFKDKDVCEQYNKIKDTDPNWIRSNPEMRLMLQGIGNVKEPEYTCETVGDLKKWLNDFLNKRDGT